MVWTLFAVAYYGFPFPNTAYAKLAGPALTANGGRFLARGEPAKVPAAAALGVDIDVVEVRGHDRAEAGNVERRRDEIRAADQAAVLVLGDQADFAERAVLGDEPRVRGAVV